MKTEENSIINIEKNGINFFLSRKKLFHLDEVFLFEKEKNSLSNFKNLSRMSEFLGIRDLRNRFFTDSEINYTDEGKPYLSNSSDFISISHSTNFLALATAPYPIGIDIEECNERILKLKDRFLSETEKMIVNTNDISSLTAAWCIKEALFKLGKVKGVDFKKDLIIEKFTIDYAEAKMKTNSSWQKVQLHLKKIDDLIICFNFE
jgi:phosphopantetheinyl transferase